VFVKEQGIAPELEWDAMDALSVHVVLTLPSGDVVATARLLPSESGTGVIGRVAVMPAFRGRHAGFAVMRALMAAARRRGDHRVSLHAQQSAQGFYQRLGFEVLGEPFDEVGIPHVTMTLEWPSSSGD
jgi:predicted GNAT family N-acyltransferase